MSYIARQPNGLLCRFSTVVDAPTHYNLTEDDVEAAVYYLTVWQQLPEANKEK